MSHLVTPSKIAEKRYFTEENEGFEGNDGLLFWGKCDKMAQCDIKIRSNITIPSS